MISWWCHLGPCPKSVLPLVGHIRLLKMDMFSINTPRRVKQRSPKQPELIKTLQGGWVGTNRSGLHLCRKDDQNQEAESHRWTNAWQTQASIFVWFKTPISWLLFGFYIEIAGYDISNIGNIVVNLIQGKFWLSMCVCWFDYPKLHWGSVCSCYPENICVLTLYYLALSVSSS